MKRVSFYFIKDYSPRTFIYVETDHNHPGPPTVYYSKSGDENTVLIPLLLHTPTSELVTKPVFTLLMNDDCTIEEREDYYEILFFFETQDKSSIPLLVSFPPILT